MRKIFMAALLGFSVVASGGENLIRQGDFTTATKESFERECGVNSGRVSLFTEDLSWNKCGKLGFNQIAPNKAGHLVAQAHAWIGGDSKQGGGFPVKPNTVYAFTLQLKGSREGLPAGLGFFYWDGPSLWKNMKAGKTTVGQVNLRKDWTTYRGTFKTGPQAQRAALGVQMWCSTQFGPMKFKADDYLLFDNLTVTEQVHVLNKRDGAQSATGEKKLRVAPIKSIRTSRTAKAPVIDGALTEAEWQDASEISDFTLHRQDIRGKAVTRVKILSDERNLYLGLVAEEPVQVMAQVQANGTGIWRGDVIEIFFGAKTKDRILSQFAIGAGGGRFFGKGISEEDNYSHWEAKTTSGPRGWTGEVRIPFAELGWDGPVQAGDLIGFNVCRQRTKAKELQSWSKLKSTFHDVDHFGMLVIEDYAAGLQRTFGGTVGPLDRAAFEVEYASRQTRRLQAKYARNANRKFAVAPVSVTSDFALPFMPDAIFEPPEDIELKAAVNEFKSLPIAVANLTDQTVEYRVTLETREGYNGEYGLKNFPKDRVTLRHGVRFRENNHDPKSLRLDPLPRMNEAYTISVPPRESGLVWIEFNTEDVKPGVYEGRLRVNPLNEPAEWKQIGGFGERRYIGAMVELPVSLTVRDIVLPKRPAIPFYLCTPGTTNEAMFRMMAEAGNEYFKLSPWLFHFGLDKAGNIDYRNRRKWGDRLKRDITHYLAWGKKYGFMPKFCLNTSSYSAVQSLYGLKHKPDRCAVIWPQWVSAVKKVMNELGIADEYYTIETMDEPVPELFETLIAVHTSAKKAAPTVRLTLTLGAFSLSAKNMNKLNPYTDGWFLWSHGYFSDQGHLDLVRKNLAAGKLMGHYTCDTEMQAHLDRNFRKNAWFGEYHQLTCNSLFWFCDHIGGCGASDWKVATWGGIAYRSFDEFVPSVRYMALRQGVMDVKYLTKLREVGKNDPEAQRFLQTAAKRVVVDFCHDPAEADKVVEETAQLIMKLQQAGAK